MINTYLFHLVLYYFILCIFSTGRPVFDRKRTRPTLKKAQSISPNLIGGQSLKNVLLLLSVLCGQFNYNDSFWNDVTKHNTGKYFAKTLIYWFFN